MGHDYTGRKQVATEDALVQAGTEGRMRPLLERNINNKEEGSLAMVYWTTHSGGGARGRTWPPVSCLGSFLQWPAGCDLWFTVFGND